MTLYMQSHWSITTGKSNWSIEILLTLVISMFDLHHSLSIPLYNMIDIFVNFRSTYTGIWRDYCYIINDVKRYFACLSNCAVEYYENFSTYQKYIAFHSRIFKLELMRHIKYSTR